MKKPRNRRPAAKDATQPPSRVQDPQGDLEAGRFREAMAGFKDQLKQGDTPEARRGLAAAYAGRAGQLADKGMLKEAWVIWDNRRQLGEALEPSPAHVDLLLRLGLAAEAAGLYAQARKAGDGALATALAAPLAARWLAGEDGMVAGLVADDPLLVHGKAARAALAAYAGGDAQALTASLATLPFRSPYRDFAQVLKALQRLPDRPQEAAALLARVPDDSAFAGLRRAAELALIPEAELPARLAGAGEAATRFALTLRGWGEMRLALWQEAARLGGNAQGLLRLMHRQRARLGEDWVRPRALRLLVADYPCSLPWLQEAGGKRPSDPEKTLVAAWRADQSGDPWRALDAWGDYADHLKAGANPTPETDAALRLALVQRHTDSSADILARAGAAGAADELSEDAADLVAESLTQDPHALDTWLRLATYYRQIGQAKEARRFLEPALARWPTDLRVLTAALDLALATQAFKKATGLARRILDLDPINSGARERLVKAHLAHARKQIRATRPDLARKELAQAQTWGGEAALGRIEVTAAFVAWVEGPDAGTAALRAQAERLGKGLDAALALAMEAAAIGDPPTETLRMAGLSRVKCKGRDDLLAALARLRAHLDGGGSLTRELGAYADRVLKAAAALALATPEAEGACETLLRAHLDEARLAFAAAALGRWPGAPRFEFHAIDAQYSRGGWVHNSVRQRLVVAHERALAEGDTRTVHRLTGLLDDFGGPLGPSSKANPFAFFEDDDDDDQDPDTALVANLIESRGLDGLISMLGLDPLLKDQMRQIERELGADGLVDLLKAMAGGRLPLPPGPLPGPRPGPRRGTGPKPAAPKGAKSPQAPEDDDTPDQLDLFF